MNQTIGRLAHNVPRIMAMTALAAAVAMGHSAGAAASDTATRTTGGVTAPMLLKVAHRQAKTSLAEEETAEARITHLHDQLGITPAQEESWGKVAVVMRKNAEQITTLVKARAENAKTMTAVDDLNSYAEIAGAHEDGTKRLIPAFKTLYNGMPEAQQKTADMVFRNYGHGHHGASHPMP